MNDYSPEAGVVICPACEVGVLRPFGRISMKCFTCAYTLGGPMLQALRNIHDLPDALGRHACECGHPEMRLLPDGIYRCPACGSEVLPVKDGNDAYECGWLEGRYGAAAGDFTENARLARWENPADRLAFYRGHRQGRADLLVSEKSVDSPEKTDEAA